MKTKAYHLTITGLLMMAFLMISGYSQSQSSCVPDSLTAANITTHTVDLSWGGITGETYVRYYRTGTTNYEYRETHHNTINIHNLQPNTPYSWDLNNFCNGQWTGIPAMAALLR